MCKKYTIVYSKHSVEISQQRRTDLVYKIPYSDIKSKKYGFDILNPFIVYILYGRNNHGKDFIYVGKSKNGLATRPSSHEDKCKCWTTCYILTEQKERTFLNDGTIQYLEDKLCKQINTLGVYNNTTSTTTSGTANESDKNSCDLYLDEVEDMLNILGLDLFTKEDKTNLEPTIITSSSDDSNVDYDIPDVFFYLRQKIKRDDNQEVKAKMSVQNGEFTVLAQSMISKSEVPGINNSIIELRHDPQYVQNGKLIKDVVFTSPSAAGLFVTGSSCDGWLSWKTEDKTAIGVYRKKK